MTDLLTDLRRSASELYAAHDLTLDIPTARRMFNEEQGELQEAATHYDDLAAFATYSFYEDKEHKFRAAIAEEAADVLYTLMGLMAACGITPEELDAAARAKIERNDQKRTENGYAVVNGKIQKVQPSPASLDHIRIRNVVQLEIDNARRLLKTTKLEEADAAHSEGWLEAMEFVLDALGSDTP